MKRGGVSARNYVLHIASRDGKTMCGRLTDDVNCAGCDVDRLYEAQKAGGTALCLACFKKRRGYENARRANAAIKAFINRRKPS